MIERHDPFGRTMSLRQLMDRLMEDAFVMAPGGGQAGEGGLGMNVYEEGDNLVVEAQTPGMKPADIDISIQNGILVVQGETKSDEERKDRNYLIREHRVGRFSRSIRLPETVDYDACRATYENGILRLTFPRSERAKPRRIQVHGSSQAGGGQPMIDTGGAGASGTAGTGGASGESRARGGSRASTGGSASAGAKPSRGGGTRSGRSGGKGPVSPST